MKKILHFFLLFNVCLFAANAQPDSITISGKLENPEANASATLYYEYGSGYKIKKIPFNNNRFSISVKKSEYHTNGFIIFKSGQRGNTNYIRHPLKNRLDLLLGNNDLTISGTWKHAAFAQVTGDEHNEIFSVLRKKRAALLPGYQDTVYEVLSMAPHPTDSLLMTLKIKTSPSPFFSIDKQFMLDHPNALATLVLLERMQFMLSADDYLEYFEKTKNLEHYSQYKRVSAFAEKLRPTKQGTEAISFSKIDIKGKVISLNDFKGKIVLLDFWGSWCGACRAGHPHLKMLHEKYKKEGLEIISIAQEYGKSIDACINNWRKAIEEDQIGVWTHLLNQQQKEKYDIVSLYGVTAFPTKLLIDRNGKIIMRTNFNTEEIDQLLKSIYGF